MEMDKNKLLIKFGVTFNYKAAFLYYNLRGILAKKWATIITKNMVIG